MSSNKKILIYSGNHKNISGIFDIIKILKKNLNLISVKNYNIVVSNKLLHNYTTIVLIENFVNIFNLIKIFFFLKKFKGKKILIVTEFITRANNYNYRKTFNNFSN